MCTKGWDCKHDSNSCECIFNKECEEMTIESFYYRSQLCKKYHRQELCSETNNGDWESFVDFAELLFTPGEYIEKTVVQLKEQQDWLEQKSSFLKKKMVDIIFGEDELKLLEGRNGKKSKNEEITEQINQLQAVDSSAYKPVNNVFVKLEYPLDNPDDEKYAKNADVVISNKNKTKLMVVELKKWTESQIEWEREQGELKIKGPGYSTKHPLIQAAFYTILLLEGPDKTISWDEMAEIGESLIERRIYSGRDPQYDSCLEIAINNTYKFKNSLRAPDDYINVTIEKDDGEESLKVSDQPYITKDMYREAYILERLLPHVPNASRKSTEEKTVVPIVYLHNQYLKNGKLYKYDKEEGYIRPAILAWLYKKEYGINTIYSRGFCHDLIRTIKEYFEE